MIAYPFRLLQCCLVTDGGGALILVAAERARDFPQCLPLAANRGPVYLLGTGESVETPMTSQMADFTSARAFRVAGPKAFAEAGITYALQESVRQMRGPAPAQIRDAKISVCHGVGGMFAASGTIIFTNQR